MKMIIAALMVVSSSAIAGSVDSDLQISVRNTCQGNNVVDKNGTIVDSCTDGDKCVLTQHTREFKGLVQVINSASCESKLPK